MQAEIDRELTFIFLWNEGLAVDVELVADSEGFEDGLEKGFGADVIQERTTLIATEGNEVEVSFALPSF